MTVTELVDWDDFVESGYAKLSFALNGPVVPNLDVDNITSRVARSGPFFCGYDNVGMTSFGVLFFDSAGNIISSSQEDVAISITLSGPFWKTVNGVRTGFSLKAYEKVPYQYSKPKILEGSRYCRTDENPTLYGELCDKSRSFQLKNEGLDSQPLPSPYAKWDVEVVEGKDLLKSRGATSLAIIASFKATKNDDLFCVAPRTQLLTLSSVLPESALASAIRQKNQAEAATVVVASVAVVALALGGLFSYAGYRRLTNREGDAEAYETEGMLPKANSLVVRKPADLTDDSESHLEGPTTLAEYHKLLKVGAISRKEYAAVKKMILPRE